MPDSQPSERRAVLRLAVLCSFLRDPVRECPKMNSVFVFGTAAAAAAGGAIAYGTAWPRAQFFGSTICRTNSARKLAITFDDGPNPAVTPRLLDLLDRYTARATFFLIGRWAQACPGIVREIAARGHAIGNHTDTHPNLLLLSRRQIVDELLRCQTSIAEAT